MESLSQRIRSERLARKIPQGTDLQESSFTPGQASYHAVCSSPVGIEKHTELQPEDPDIYSFGGKSEDSQFGHSIVPASQTELGEDPTDTMMEDILHIPERKGYDATQKAEVHRGNFSELDIAKQFGLHVERRKQED